ncbi:VOC family protein [Actinopolyspora mortivallis]|uniref:VOC family protein n=1 Tax=Actinopolyspora mortivallis TaxID=33906 RepID=UPI000367774C|nr:VOC family protein [Actinopolyspora mortivallis]
MSRAHRESTEQRRAFPVLYTPRVTPTVRFYERLGFCRRVQHPPDGEPGFVGMVRDSAELAVAYSDTPVDQGVGPVPGDGPFELFVLLGDVDATVRELREQGVPVVREPVDMPWGERVATLTDPSGNRVAVASPVDSALS